MSHELRTPLGAILGFAQLIESGAPQPTPSQKRSVDQILKAGWYLLDLINEVLDLALIESGKLSLSPEPVSLTDVMLECQTMIEPQAQRRGIRVSFPRLETPHFVKADRTRVKQVLINLLSNAIKYNKAGGTVLVACVVNTPGRVRIGVEDTGEGLSPADIAQLFQPAHLIRRQSQRLFVVEHLTDHWAIFAGAARSQSLPHAPAPLVQRALKALPRLGQLFGTGASTLWLRAIAGAANKQAKPRTNYASPVTSGPRDPRGPTKKRRRTMKSTLSARGQMKNLANIWPTNFALDIAIAQS
jgi:hypothetical protein